MRISERILSTVLFGLGLGLATAYAFDGTRSPSDIAPAVGIELTPRAAPVPGVAAAAGALTAPSAPQGGFSLQSLPQGGGLTSFQAFQSGTRALRAGDTQAGLSALEYAAANGQPMAAWKLGRMYADGDGVKHNDLRAFEYFRGVADAHADEVPGTPQARFVANAFVALGSYYLDGIPNSDVKADADRAREMFAYAASYFGDPDAQYISAACISTAAAASRSPSRRRAGCCSPPARGSIRPRRCSAPCCSRANTCPARRRAA